jgi:hypothetical protein
MAFLLHGSLAKRCTTGGSRRRRESKTKIKEDSSLNKMMPSLYRSFVIVKYRREEMSRMTEEEWKAFEEAVGRLKGRKFPGDALASWNGPLSESWKRGILAAHRDEEGDGGGRDSVALTTTWSTEVWIGGCT